MMIGLPSIEINCEIHHFGLPSSDHRHLLLTFNGCPLTIQILDPPFDKSTLNPGYIKGYVPGVRKNGGQYTQGAIWAAMAFAALGDSRRTWELLAMINPLNHARSLEGIATYKVEPYVVAADVYALSPHTGRGGWAWYTGSAGWMYRPIVESLLGLRLEVDKLRFTPCLPVDWKAFKVHYRYRETVYHIAVLQTRVGNRETSMTVDGVERPAQAIPLVDDRQEHSVEVRISAAGSSREESDASNSDNECAQLAYSASDDSVLR